ncbi:PmoA family protein [Aurantibacter crassamenti]|uniref:DUF6807 domain-containing protein n=1 Tax=Aurantibacter crassamenti TaxID=1837375 RepID=UPI00193AA322|nr:PmoA family protein [Aurantibacter crassamenti]MBM1105156.1 PmoA family protein [Aurantibacter crassamenti]
MKILIPVFLTFLLLSSSCKEKTEKNIENKGATTNNITLENNEADKKVTVHVDGKLFTSYLYSDDISVLKKTTLYPIIAANGETITRGYPLNTRPNERTDHPHHIGAWLNFGDVNGLDFWGNSDEIKTPKEKLGTIRHDKIISLENGAGSATMIVTANWLNPNETILLKEETKFIFYAENGKRIIDRITTLKALDTPVNFNDTKEGMFAIRTARELEHPSDGEVTLSDANGNKTDVPVTDNTGVSGEYLSSEGIKGSDVWGTRAKWMALSGTINEKDVTLLLMDQPQNIGYPTYWHARGYGLFAANPLGQKAFTDGKEESLNFSLKPNTEITFTYRIEVLDGKKDKAQLEAEYNQFAQQ